MTSARRAWVPLFVLAIILVGALIVGRGRESNTVEARAGRIASTIKCLVCQGLSVEQSKAGSARLIYQEIERQVRDGRTDTDIRAYLEDRYGADISLVPTSSGAGAIVWGLPVALTIAAFAGLIAVFRRWRKAAGVTVPALTGTDVDLVSAARSRRVGTAVGGDDS